MQFARLQGRRILFPVEYFISKMAEPKWVKLSTTRKVYRSNSQRNSLNKFQHNKQKQFWYTVHAAYKGTA